MSETEAPSTSIPVCPSTTASGTPRPAAYHRLAHPSGFEEHDTETLDVTGALHAVGHDEQIG